MRYEANRIVFVLSCLSKRLARCSGYKTVAVPLLPSEISEIYGAFKFAFPAFDLCVSGTVRIHTLDAKSADGTFEIRFIHVLHLVPREFKQSQHFRAGRVTSIIFDLCLHHRSPPNWRPPEMYSDSGRISRRDSSFSLLRNAE